MNNIGNGRYRYVVLVALAMLMVLVGNDSPIGPLASQAEAARPTDKELEDMFQRAIMLSQYGFFAEAEKTCRDILKYNPDQPTVSAFLKQLESKKPKPDMKAILRRKMETIIIPQLRILKAAAPDVFQLLSDESLKNAADKQRVNFVLFLPPDVQLQPVTLQLDNVTLYDAVKYVTIQTGLRYFIDDNAVVIYHDSKKPELIPDEPKSEPHAQP
jgi:hypothetical protein